MGSIGDYYKAAYPVPPYASADPRVVLDYGVGSANPWSTNGTTLNAQYGFSAVGSGHQFDPALGLNCGSAGYITTSTALTGAPSAEGTIYLEFDRVGMSEVQTDGTTFYDNIGITRNAATRMLMRCGNFGTNFIDLVCNIGALTQSMNADVTFASSSQTNLPICSHFNSRASSAYVDPRFCSFMLTWRGAAFYFYLDGQFIASTQTPMASAPTTQLFSAMTLGSNNGAANSYFQAWIRRFQITNTYTQVPVGGPLIGVLGDSFVQGLANIPTPGGDPAPTIAQVNAVQYFNGSPTKRATAPAGYQSQFGNTCALMGISSAVFKQLGFLPNFFVSGAPGHGYSTSLSQFGVGYGDAMIAAQPEILICLGSVNDINTGITGNLGTDTKAKIDYITAGKAGGAANWTAGVTQYPQRLRRIFFFEAFSWEGIGGAPSLPSFIPQRKANWISQFAALNGQSSNGVPITVIPVCDTTNSGFGWNTDPAFRTFFDDPSNPNDMASSTSGHPCATGEIRIANIIAPYLLAALQSSPW